LEHSLSFIKGEKPFQKLTRITVNETQANPATLESRNLMGIAGMQTSERSREATSRKRKELLEVAVSALQVGAGLLQLQ
jgi:hypothetical protein